MGWLFSLSLRNLLRQKRRNLLLGIGIGFGMMILVVANSFSHGMVDVLINEVVAKAFGHLVIDSRIGNSRMAVIRDKARYERIIRETVKKEDLVYLDENIGMFGQAIGNGETDNVVIVGVSPKTEAERRGFFDEFFTLVSGNFKEYFSRRYQYPVIISSEKAKSLKVKVHDTLNVRLPMITGQMQAAKLTVIAIANSNNSFMNIVLFMETGRVKQLLGYKPWESAALQLTLKDPKRTAAQYAGQLHERLKPGILAVNGRVGATPVQIVAYKNDDSAKALLRRRLQIVAGDAAKAFGKDGVMLPEKLAQSLQLRPGRKFVFQYPTQFRGQHEETWELTATYRTLSKLNDNVIVMNAEKLYDPFNRYLPADRSERAVATTDPVYSALATEWKLLNRSADSEGLRKKYQQERRTRTDQTKVDVITMYEGASDILKLEGVLNLVTVIAVLVIFFIILIGVVNTLRMTIRERTREIGTIRAIGMQKNDVRNLFILETLQLTAIACAVGIVLGIGVMGLLGSIRFDVDNALSMILKNKHLYFQINPAGLAANFLLIMAIAGLTAYFPARRAAKLTAAEALRHYE